MYPLCLGAFVATCAVTNIITHPSIAKKKILFLSYSTISVYRKLGLLCHSNKILKTHVFSVKQ